MTASIFVTDGYFDGRTHCPAGPFTFFIRDGRIAAITEGDLSADVHTRPEGFREQGVRIERAAFLMPGLVEAHCHIFLDGRELDFKARTAYLKSSEEDMLAMARRNVQANFAAGVILLRDAGDKHGINHRLRDEMNDAAAIGPEIRSPGLGIRKPKRYGGFMAREVDGAEEITRAIDQLLETGDELKVILTGIIDFETGGVKGAPQFDLEEAKLIQQRADHHQRRTFAHCSGIAGLEVAVGAGFSSIEHGFFMERRILEIMAEKRIAWVPTFSPVHFQWARPELVGWNEETVGNLKRILDSHREHVRIAHDMGVDLVAGSDAGSYGVGHGQALIDELFFFLDAGLSMEAVLRSAISVPRRLWDLEGGALTAGGPAEFISLAGSPFAEAENLRRVVAVFKKGRYVSDLTRAA